MNPITPQKKLTEADSCRSADENVSPSQASIVVSVSDLTKRSHNPIRKITESLKKPLMPDKPHIALSLGDPTVFGNLPTTRVLKDALIDTIESVSNALAGDTMRRRIRRFEYF